VQSGLTVAAQAAFVPSGDVGDTLATATAITLPVDANIAVPGTVGDGANGAKDVDLYQLTLGTGEQLSVVLNGVFYGQIRFFNAAGQQVGTQFGPYVNPGTTSLAGQFIAPAAGTYYVGITGYSNTSYDPTVAGSGTNASYTGAYTLTLERMAAGGTRLRGIVATASSGTAATSGVASANIGQTITLNGSGLLSGDQVMFTSLDDNGSLYMQGVTPTTVAADGSSLTVVVPTNATTGTLRLARENFGLLLQVVPTLTHVDVNINGVFNGGGASITGSGFAEGQTTLNFGASKLPRWAAPARRTRWPSPALPQPQRRELRRTPGLRRPTRGRRSPSRAAVWTSPQTSCSKRSTTTATRARWCCIRLRQQPMARRRR
jgi:hypothetical protein